MLQLIQKNNIKTLTETLINADNTARDEFVVALQWDPTFVAELMYHSYLPMMEQLENEEGQPFILLPKLHFERSLLDFDDLHISKRIVKKLDAYELTCNYNFKNTLIQTISHHEHNWILEPLQQTFIQLNVSSNLVKTCSFELWNKQTNQIVAGELGYFVGSVYTSLSGYHKENNSGKIQMILLSKWLESKGTAYWDLGMDLDYKQKLGAKLWDTASFYDRLKSHRDDILHL